MSIGIIIFVISVVISIIKAVIDNSDKERDPSKPKKQTQNDDGFFGEIKKNMREIEREFSDDDSSKRTNKVPRPDYQPNGRRYKNQTRPEKMDNEQPQPVTQTTSHVEEQPSQAEQTKRRQLDRDEEKRAELQRDMFTRIDDIRDQINRESDQRLERLEKKAQAIISDSTLSTRAKQVRLNQLFNRTSRQSQSTQSSLAFHKDDVVNGIIWSEILNKPKQL